MKRIFTFAAGFAAGWIARSTVDTSREAFVKLGASSYNMMGRMRRIFALERERFDDFVAEARARSTREPARAAASNHGPPGASMEAPRSEQAA